MTAVTSGKSGVRQFLRRYVAWLLRHRLARAVHAKRVCDIRPCRICHLDYMDVDCQQREREHSYRDPAPFREQCEHGIDFKVAACVVSRGFPGGYAFDLWCICCVCAGGYHFYKGAVVV